MTILHSRNRRVLVLSAAAIFVVYVFGAGQAARLVSQNGKRSQQQYTDKLSDEWIKSQIEALASGQTSHVFFYGTSKSDSLVSRLAGMSEVKRLTFENTDLTNSGLNDVAMLPNLEKLTILGGATGDAGLESLSHNRSLRTLHLVHLELTDDGLAALQSLSELEYLTIYRDHRSNNKLTNLAVQHLRGLRNLKRLNIGGGWLSTTAVDELKSYLPNCEVIDKYADDEW
jgi:hypothetical protein